MPGWCSFLRRRFDAAFVGELAQHALERGAVGVLQAEGAGDLARADLAGLLADEGERGRLWTGRAAVSCGRFMTAGREVSSSRDQLGVPALACASVLAAARLAQRGLTDGFRLRLGRRLSCAPAWLGRARRGGFGLAAAFGLRRCLARGAALPSPARFACRRRARRARRAAPTACSSVIVSGVMSDGSVALTPSWLT